MTSNSIKINSECFIVQGIQGPGRSGSCLFYLPLFSLFTTTSCTGLPPLSGLMLPFPTAVCKRWPCLHLSHGMPSHTSDFNLIIISWEISALTISGIPLPKTQDPIYSFPVLIPIRKSLFIYLFVHYLFFLADHEKKENYICLFAIVSPAIKRSCGT